MMAVVYGAGGFDPDKPGSNIVQILPDVASASEPTLEDKLAQLSEAVDALILDALGGGNV